MTRPEGKLRIGTWNLDNRIPTQKHREILLSHECDVWLLTELNPRWRTSEGGLGDWNVHVSKGVMGRKQHWAAIVTKHACDPLADPHPTSAAAVVNGVTYWSTILPWRGVKAGSAPWSGSNHAEMTAAAVNALRLKVPKGELVWGGDWNHSLVGKEHAGSTGGRKHVLNAIETLGLTVPTSTILHRGDYCNAIDHIGVPKHWGIDGAYRIEATSLSDHDAYIVDVTPAD